MSTLFRHSLRLSITQATAYRPTTLTASPIIQQRRRAYAAKRAKSKHGRDAESPHGSGSKRAPIATESLTPGSQQALADPTARDEFARTDAKMAACVERLRREVAQLEARASGRVTPQLLAPVRVSVAPSSSASAAGKGASVSTKVRLEEVATVGVRDGSTLIVTVFEPQVRLVVSCAPKKCILGVHSRTLILPSRVCDPGHGNGISTDWAVACFFSRT
jgi:ribosome recycling factor